MSFSQRSTTKEPY